jgi:thiamine biosynthesis lipoprotein
MCASKTQNSPSHFDFKAMGSPCTITVYTGNALDAINVIQKATAEINRLENKFSRYIKDNVLDLVNQAAQKGTYVDVDDEFISLLHYADTCYQQSLGLFDITAGALRQVWDFSHNNLPSDADIRDVLQHIGWQHVKIDNNRVHFLTPNMELDFGGIVKEYAADSAANICASQGIQHGLINLGGDIKAIGPHPNGKPWQINIRDARNPGQHKGVIDLYNEGLATSGDYERFIDIDGQRYSHILSPKTGWPVKGLTSVTVKAPQCVIAGSACTIAMLMEHNGIDWLNTLGVECLWQD